MTLAVEIKPLIAALRKVSAACQPSKLWDVLKCVHLQCEAGSLSIAGYNLAHEVTVRLPANGSLPPCLVNAEMLSAWLSRCADRGEVKVSLADQATKWTAGGGSSRFATVPVEQWPTPKAPELTHVGIVSASALADAIGSSLSAVRDDPSRPFLSGVRLETGSIVSGGSPDRLAVCGTNGIMLVARDIAATGLVAAGGCIVPIEAAKAIRSLLAGADTATIAWGADRVELSAGDVLFRATLIDARYPESWRSVSGSPPASLSYDAKAFTAALATVAALAPVAGKSRIKTVTLSFDGERTEVATLPSGDGWSGQDTCSHSALSDELPDKATVGVDQIISILSALGSETVEMAAPGGERNPVVFYAATMSDRIACTMPVRA